MDSTLDHEIHHAVQQLNAKQVEKQIALIKHASEIAQDRIDYHVAHDDHILRAIEIVEDFLRKRHRICYGGQAINAHLPDAHKIYDPEYSIPDYDFFSPKPEADIEMIVHDLKRAGFDEISAREGMHEGTVKIYVEYIPVADITAMDPKLYRILSKREFRRDGISYLDANTLRMLMYLELSRPRGEVSRWPKIYERLMLFNEYVSRNQCRIAQDPFNGTMTKEQVEFTLNYIIEQKRVFAGGDLIQFYRQVVHRGTKHMDWILRSKKPILFYSPEPEKDAQILQNEFNFIIKQTYLNQELNRRKQQLVTIRSHESKASDMIPSMKIIGRGKQALVFIIHQTACHSYINIPMRKDKILRIASMDTLITLYFSLGLFKSNYFDMGSLECMANQLIQINMNARSKSDSFVLPFVSVICSGHQTSLPSLIRAKVQRIMTKKKAMDQVDKKASLSKKRNHPTVKQTNKRANKKLLTLSKIEQVLLK